MVSKLQNIPTKTVVMMVLMMGAMCLVTNGFALTKIFTDTANNFSIEYPALWTYEKLPTAVVFRGEKNTPSYYSTVNIQIVATKKSGGEFITVHEFIDDLIKQFVAGASDTKVIDQGAIMLTAAASKKLSGAYVTVSYTYKHEKFKQMQFVFLGDNGQHFYALGYTAPADQYDADLPLAKSMYHSWVIQQTLVGPSAAVVHDARESKAYYSGGSLRVV